MTINAIGSSTSLYAAQPLCLDTEGQLAVLLLQTQEEQQASDRESQALARARFIEASNERVAAMHEEADAVRLGAYFQAGASVAAAGIQIGDELMPPPCDKAGKVVAEKPWGEIGAAAANAASQPLGKLLGDAPAADARADAQRSATSAQLAEWDLANAKDALQQSDAKQDKITEWLSSETSSQANASAAIISGLA
jgi:hypothetical protein